MEEEKIIQIAVGNNPYGTEGDIDSQETVYMLTNLGNVYEKHYSDYKKDWSIHHFCNIDHIRNRDGDK